MSGSENVLLWIAIGALGFCVVGIITAQKRAKRDNERQLELIQKRIAQKEKQAAEARAKKADVKTDSGENQKSS